MGASDVTLTAQWGQWLYVDKDATTGANHGSSWANAYTGVQAALVHTNANPGQDFEVWVADGTYTPGSARRFLPHRAGQCAALRRLRRDGNGRSQRDWVAYPTILSGDIGAPGDNSDNSYHVLWVDGVTYQNITGDTAIDGFTISAGNANGGSWPHNAGGGLYCGGIDSGHECSPALTNVTFSGNQAIEGGGMFNDGYNAGVSSPTLTNVTFSGNGASEVGGGMFNKGGFGVSSPTLTNVTFSGNQARNGGGMFNYGPGGVSSPTLTNVTFSGNGASETGGGMFNHVEAIGGVGNPTLINCILWGNTAPTGSQIFDAGATPTVSYSLIEGGCPAGAACGAGMLDTDPLFVDVAGGNLRLNFGSPAIDTGTDTVCPRTTWTACRVPMTGTATTQPPAIWAPTRPARWCAALALAHTPSPTTLA